MPYRQTLADTSEMEAMTSGRSEQGCLVNCEESRFTIELSTAATPGFSGLCGGGGGGGGGFFSRVACLFEHLGGPVGRRVCDRMHLFETGAPEDVDHLRKRRRLCSDQFMSVWKACGDKVSGDPHRVSEELIACLKENATVEELIDVKETIGVYGR